MISCLDSRYSFDNILICALYNIMIPMTMYICGRHRTLIIMLKAHIYVGILFNTFCVICRYINSIACIHL